MTTPDGETVDISGFKPSDFDFRRFVEQGKHTPRAISIACMVYYFRVHGDKWETMDYPGLRGMLEAFQYFRVEPFYTYFKGKARELDFSSLIGTGYIMILRGRFPQPDLLFSTMTIGYLKLWMERFPSEISKEISNDRPK